MGLLKYLELNSAKKFYADNPHDRLFLDVISILNQICEKSPEDVFKSVNLIDEKKYPARIVRRPDLIAITGSDLYVIECKSTRNEWNIDRTKERINEQLTDARDFFKENFDISAQCIGAYRTWKEKEISYYPFW